MLKYAVVEIAGRQYKVGSNQTIKVNSLGPIDSFECDKVLLINEGEDLKIGNPYLKEKLSFEVVGNIRAEKIRVATYKAKANTRKVKGSRAQLSVLKLKA